VSVIRSLLEKRNLEIRMRYAQIVIGPAGSGKVRQIKSLIV
jgi:Fe-S cluster assembly ATPase SufC